MTVTPRSASMLLLLLLLPAATVRATVTLADTGTRLHSRPAAFGRGFEYGLQYVARLQADADDPHLCGGAEEGAPSARGADGAGRRGLRATAPPRAFDRTADGAGPRELRGAPSHGIPVALLARRGGCAYETKARVAAAATSPQGAVRFVIVYDDRAEDGGQLIKMMPRDAAAGGSAHRPDRQEGVGLVFVSYESGVELRDFLAAQSRQTVLQGGPRVLLDGDDSWSATDLAFMFVLLGCFLSVSLFVNTRLYTGQGLATGGAYAGRGGR